MERRKRSNVVGGILLILLGLLFMAFQFAPQQFAWLRIEMTWPLIVVGVGLFLLVFGCWWARPGWPSRPASWPGSAGCCTGRT
jgi:uncharacterized integral membrane protein